MLKNKRADAETSAQPQTRTLKIMENNILNSTKLQSILERTKLCRLPSLAQRKPVRDLPNIKPPKSKNTCLVCDHRIKSETAFHMSARVCGDCLRIYSAVDAALNTYADTKARDAKLKKIGGLK